MREDIINPLLKSNKLSKSSHTLQFKYKYVNQKLIDLVREDIINPLIKSNKLSRSSHTLQLQIII